MDAQDNKRNFWTVDSSDPLAYIIQKYGRAGVVEPDHLFGESSIIGGTGITFVFFYLIYIKRTQEKRRVR